MKISKANAEHYLWKNICDGWHLVQRDDLSIISEKMPAGTAEDIHYHEKSRQFFYILSGTAPMLMDNETIILRSGEGIEVRPGSTHQLRNDSEGDIEFIVISAPKSHGDRINVEQK